MFKARFVRVRILGVTPLLLKSLTKGLVIRSAKFRRISGKFILLFRLIQYSFLLKKLDYSQHLLFIIPLANLADSYYSLRQVFGYHFPIHISISWGMVIGKDRKSTRLNSSHGYIS